MRWLKKLISPGSNHRKVRVLRLNDDASYYDNRDVLSGLQFCATLHLTTPLNILAHHGEIFSGPPSQAPQYGNAAQGIWVPKTKAWRDLGIDIDEFPESAAASDLGPILPSKYLPFLLEFRRIIESDATPDTKLAQLRNMSTKPVFSHIWEMAARSYRAFPESFV